MMSPLYHDNNMQVVATCSALAEVLLQVTIHQRRHSYQTYGTFELNYRYIGEGNNLLTQHIAAVTSLCITGHSNRDMHTLTDVRLRSIKWQTKASRKSPSSDIRLQNKQSVTPRKFDRKPRNIIMRLPENNSHSFVRNLKGGNPKLLSNVSLALVHRHIHKYFGFTRKAACQKPLVRNYQIEYFSIVMGKHYVIWLLLLIAKIKCQYLYPNLCSSGQRDHNLDMSGNTAWSDPCNESPPVASTCLGTMHG